MSTGTTEDDRAHRWAEAEAIASGDHSPAVTEGIRRRRKRRWLLVVVFVVVLMSVGALAGYLAANSEAESGSAASDSSNPLWADLLGLAFAVGCLLLVGLGIFQMVRAGSFGGRWRMAASALTWKERSALRREVLGRRPLDPAHLIVARDLARQMTRTNGLFTMYGGLVVGQVSQCIFSPDLWRLALLAALTLVFVFGGLSTWRDANRARTFLEQHPRTG